MTSPTPFASGRDADVYLIEADRVLRRYRAGGDVTAEAAVMRYLADQGFPVPRVYAAQGPDLILERLTGPTLAEALFAGELTPTTAASVLAELHARLHSLPARLGTDPADRILHLDLHPLNVIMTPDGPVLIDWRNSAEGPSDLDTALSALILGQVAVDPDLGYAGPAAALLSAFLAVVEGDPLRMLDRAVRLRRDHHGQTPAEVGRLGHAVALVRSAAAPGALDGAVPGAKRAERGAERAE